MRRPDSTVELYRGGTAVKVILPSGFCIEVTVEDDITIGDLMDEMSRDMKTKYRLAYSASTGALLDISRSASCISDDAVSLEEEALVPPNITGQLQLLCDFSTVEKDFCRALRSIIKVYADPLRKFSSMKRSDHDQLFYGVSPLICMCEEAHHKVLNIVNSWDISSARLANIFNKKFCQHFEIYLEHWPTKKRLLSRIIKADKEFTDFCNFRQGCGRYSLIQLLFLPVQRIPDYEHFLSSMLAETTPDQEDYEVLSRALARVKTMVKRFQEDVPSSEVTNENKVEGVQERFPHDDLQLSDLEKLLQKQVLQSRRKSAPGGLILRTLKGRSLSTSNVSLGKSKTLLAEQLSSLKLGSCEPGSRIYLLEGPVRLMQGLQVQDRYLFLFNDLLLVAKQKSQSTFKLKDRIRVGELWISDCLEDVSEATHSYNTAFVLGWPTTNYVVSFADASTKDRWLSKLQDAIEVEKNKEKPPSIYMKVLIKDPNISNIKSKSLSVLNTEETRYVVKRCVQDFGLKGDESNYRLWVSQDSDSMPYPLIGHEHPYSIKMNQFRDGKSSSSLDINQAGLDDESTVPVQFVLRGAQKTDGTKGLDDLKKRNKTKPARSPFNLFKRKSHDLSPSIPTGCLFGHRIQDLVVDGKICKPLMDILNYLYVHAPTTKGIFRQAGNAKSVRALRDHLDSGEDFNPEEVTPHVVASLVKEFLRSLPDCLLMCELYTMWSAAAATEAEDEKIRMMQHVTERLPSCNRCLLQYVICLLAHIASNSEHNKMTSANLAVCISHSLLWCSPLALQDSAVQQQEAKELPCIVEALIDHAKQILGEDRLNVFPEDVVMAKTLLKPEASTDSDSVHSMQSGSRLDGTCQDNSSTDSLDRDLYSENDTSSPSLKTNHTNLSHDSGLFSSDNQLYEESGDQSTHQVLRTVSCETDTHKNKLKMAPMSGSYDSGHTDSMLHPDMAVRDARRKRYAFNSESSGSQHLSSSLSSHSDYDMLFTSNSSRNDSQDTSDDNAIDNPVLCADGLTLRKSDSGARIFLNDALLCEKSPRELMMNIPEEDSLCATVDTPVKPKMLLGGGSLEEAEVDVKDMSAASSTSTLVDSTHSTPRCKSPASQTASHRAPSIQYFKPRSLDFSDNIDLISIPVSRLPLAKDSISLRLNKPQQVHVCDVFSGREDGSASPDSCKTSHASRASVHKSPLRQDECVPYAARLVRDIQASSFNSTDTSVQVPKSSQNLALKHAPPSYDEAVKRKRLFNKAGHSKVSMEETEQQRKRSEKARQLYRASLEQYSLQGSSSSAYFSEPETAEHNIKQQPPQPPSYEAALPRVVQGREKHPSHIAPPSYQTVKDQRSSESTAPILKPGGEQNGQVKTGIHKRAKSRERLSDTHLDNRRRRKKGANLSRSKSDSSKHFRRQDESTDSDEREVSVLTRLPRLRVVQTLNSPSTYSSTPRSRMRVEQSGTVDSGRSRSEWPGSKDHGRPWAERPGSIDSINYVSIQMKDDGDLVLRTATRARAERPKTMDPATLLTHLEQAGYRDEKDEDDNSKSAAERRKSWTMKNKPWHKELSEQYGDGPLQAPQSREQVLVQYTRSDSNEGQKWVKPPHPTKDLIMTKIMSHGPEEAIAISQPSTSHVVPVTSQVAPITSHRQVKTVPKQQSVPVLPSNKTGAAEMLQPKSSSDSDDSSRLGWSVSQLRKKYDKDGKTVAQSKIEKHPKVEYV